MSQGLRPGQDTVSRDGVPHGVSNIISTTFILAFNLSSSNFVLSLCRTGAFIEY